MKSRLSTPWRAAALLALLPLCVHEAASAQGFKWWQDEQFQRELQLTGEQIARIDGIFQASVPEFRQQKKALDRLEDELSRLINTSADEAAVMAQADRVEEIRAALSKARTRMLFRIRLVLTEEQRQKFVALHQEYERTRKRQDRRH